MIKINLEKAYDRVIWDFINASLKATSIPDYLRNIILPSITNSTMQIMWNGVRLLKFKPVRGIRQGCSLSPYLFVLCMKWLDHSIQSTISTGKWNPSGLSRSRPTLSHLFFVDDHVLFNKADLKHGKVLKKVLKIFCEISGHKINVRKTNIFFSKGVDEPKSDVISNLFGFQKVQDLRRYLGVPLFH